MMIISDQNHKFFRKWLSSETLEFQRLFEILTSWLPIISKANHGNNQK